MTARRVIALLAALGIGACASNGPARRAAMDRVLAADGALAAERNEAVRVEPLGVVARRYADALDAIDYQDAPPEFERAMRAHADAWRRFADAASPFADIRAEMHEAIDAALSQGGPEAAALDRALDEVWSTWAEVDRAARRRGVEPG